jgi:hypothetical protein
MLIFSIRKLVLNYARSSGTHPSHKMLLCLVAFLASIVTGNCITLETGQVGEINF